jgi:DNA-binding beta-propeller fold protein YncE
MIKSKTLKYILTLLVITLNFSCNEKFDITQFDTNDPGNIGGDTIYVKLNPDWNGFNHPEDIIVGREPLIYVADTDNDRIVMLNLNGNILGVRSIKHPVAIAQDYMLNLLVCGQFDTLGQTFSAVYKIDLFNSNHNLETASIKRILPQLSDLNKPDRKYTAVTVFYDNSYVVARTGPNNTNLIDPDNSLLKFITQNDRAKDSLIGRVALLQPTGTGILSVNVVSSLKSFNKRNYDIVVNLVGDNNFKTQWFRYVSSQDFTGYENNLTPAASDIMTPGFFISPQGSEIDASGNIYVAESSRDSVYKFNSFGDKLIGFGGPTVFSEPYAVAYFDKILYVADRGNNRILRFQLSTDIN